jgi:hypothetical protein
MRRFWDYRYGGRNRLQDSELLEYLRENETIAPSDPLVDNWEEEERMEEADE